MTTFELIRICYEKGDFLTSDTCYIFVEGRDNSFVIPMMGIGGSELWGEILERDLFPAEIFLKFLTGEERLLCHVVSGS